VVIGPPQDGGDALVPLARRFHALETVPALRRDEEDEPAFVGLPRVEGPVSRRD
jgi:hypothetical protein